MSGYGSIVGRVLDDHGLIAGATVIAISAAHPHRDFATFTADDGAFRFGAMAPGNYRLEVRMGGRVRAADVMVAPDVSAEAVVRLAGVPDNDIMFVSEGRTRVTNLSQYPWRCVCSLLITAATGATRIGSGWLAGPRLVMTAGHCLFMADEGGWAAQVEVIPGRNGAERPFGSAIAPAANLRCPARWIDDEDPDFDYGGIVLPSDTSFGERLGWFGYTPRPDEEIRQAPLHVAGYPGDGGTTHQEGTQWYGKGAALDIEPRQMTYAIAAMPGHGGSPVWITTAQNDRYCVAIHSSGGAVAHAGTRVVPDVFDDIARWAAHVD